MPMKSKERIVEVNGVEPYTQTFGDADDPAVLLVMGLAASMLYWEDEFCDRLADGSRFVIRGPERHRGYPRAAPASSSAERSAIEATRERTVQVHSGHERGSVRLMSRCGSAPSTWRHPVGRSRL